MKNKILFYFIIFICIFSFLGFINPVNADDLDIAKKYAPILYFEKDEACFPVNISYHVENSYLYIINQESPIDTLPSTDNLPTDNKNYYLDNKLGTIDDDKIIIDYNKRNLEYTVYANIIYSGDLTYIQYWMFYAFNDGTLNQHEGDWEMVQILLSSGSPSQVMFSQHHSGQKATWNQVEKQGDHIKVYVSRGSHANYLRSYSGVIGLANDIVGDNGKKISFSDYNIVILTDQPWLEYKGRWGWSGETDEGYQEAVLLGKIGPYGPKYRNGGNMWSAIGWGSTLLPANEYVFIGELFLYNFVTIFIVISLIIICIISYRIYRRKKLTGLGPRLISMLYIDGFNIKSIGNILCILGIIIAIYSLFNPWYLISTDITIEGYETSGLANIMSIDGFNGVQLQIPGITGVIPFGSIKIPFSLVIGFGLIFLILATIGLSKSKKLGNKYLFKGLRLLVPIIIIILIIIGLRFLPFDYITDSGNTGLNIGEIIGSISNSPLNGQKLISIEGVDGQVQLHWGLGLGGILLLFSGLILIISGFLERIANEELFEEKNLSETKNVKKSEKKDEKKKKNDLN
jgi:hypothetical protein